MMKTYITLLAALFYFTAHAQTENAIRLRNFNLVDNDIAIRYFDPVSYFKGRPLKGDSQFHHTYKGITYHFANKENLEEFKANSGKYEPAYGGWCAYHMAKDGQRVKVDPTTYKIIDGRVFLFNNFGGKNVLPAWNKDEKKLKLAADKFWVNKMR